MSAFKKIHFGGWPNCLRLSDGRTEAVVTADVGPRIIRFGFTGGPNLLKEVAGDRGATGGKTWRLYGGHRLWIAPEMRERTTVPDNGPVRWRWDGRTLTLVSPADRRFRIRKELRVGYTNSGTLRLRHRLVNESRKTVELAPWAITVMVPGGEAVIPQEPLVPHPESLLPVRPLVLWSYADMGDPA